MTSAHSAQPEQELPPGTLRRHRHAQPYAAIVLAGSYLELGDTGRWRTEAGDIVVHAPFEAHTNVIGQRGACVINLTLPLHLTLPPAFRVADTDAVVRLARTDPRSAWRLLVPVARCTSLADDWPALLAAAIRRSPALSITHWAMQVGLAPATVSRGFHAAFGVSPAKYRAETRARVAWERIAAGQDQLAAIAHDCGFADQPHLTRAITALTGASPKTWRGVKSVQDRRTR